MPTKMLYMSDGIKKNSLGLPNKYNSLLLELDKCDFGSDIWGELIDEMILNDPNGSEESKIEYLNRKEKLKRKLDSQNKYLLENKGKKLLCYDVENFFPIYEGVDKWVWKDE